MLALIFLTIFLTYFVLQYTLASLMEAIMKKDTLLACPVCEHDLEIVRYRCPSCNTTIDGKFKPSGLSGLTSSQQEFVTIFMLAEGNIKEVEKQLNISYPTVKARLKEIKAVLQSPRKEDDLLLILEGIEDGELSVDDAIAKIEKRR